MADPKLVMLVDDDSDWLDIGRLTLEAAGYRVVCCFDAEQGWAKLANLVPDLIVTDLMMRSLEEGFEFARALKANPRTCRIPILIYSGIKRELGLTFAPVRKGDLSAMGVEAFLEKPARPSLVLANVRALLDAPTVGGRTHVN